MLTCLEPLCPIIMNDVIERDNSIEEDTLDDVGNLCNDNGSYFPIPDFLPNNETNTSTKLQITGIDLERNEENSRALQEFNITQIQSQHSLTSPDEIGILYNIYFLMIHSILNPYRSAPVSSLSLG